MWLTAEPLTLTSHRDTRQEVFAYLPVWGISSWTGTYVAAFQSCTGFLFCPALLLLRHTSSHRALSGIFAEDRTALGGFPRTSLTTCLSDAAARCDE